MKNDEVLELLKQFGHWAALCASIAIVGVTVAFGGDATSLKQKNDTKNDMRKLESEIGRLRPPTKSVTDFFPEIKKNWEAKFEVVAGPNHGSLYPPAEYKYKFEPAPADQWISAPQNLELEIGREKISVSWESSPELSGKEMTTIEGYLLFRSWEEKGKKRQQIIPFSDSELSFEDTKVESSVKYQYHVVAYTNNTKSKGGKKYKYKKPILISSPTEKKSGEILPLYEMKLLGVGRDMAMLQLRKWEKGDWRTTNCRINRGKPIETKAAVKELQNKIVHFKPGWVLRDLTTKAKRFRVLERKVIARDKNGKIIINEVTKRPEYEIKKIKQKYFTSAIRYIDEKGKTRVLFQVK